MTATIVVPVSREEHLPRLFRSLELLECDAGKTSLFVYVDGNESLYVQTRNLTEQSRFLQRLCVQRHKSLEPIQKFNLLARRRRIASIHNEIRGFLKPCDYVFLIEDDTVVPLGALKSLQKAYALYPHAGFVSGVELGRHGIAHVGAWMADDVYEPTRIESITLAQLVHDGLASGQGYFEPGLDSGGKLTEISYMTGGPTNVDAAGMYCLLTKYDHYAKHEFKPFDGNTLGPDVDWSLSLRQQGYRNYVDWTVKCDHMLPNGEVLSLSNTDIVQVAMVKKDNGTWRQEIVR